MKKLKAAFNILIFSLKSKENVLVVMSKVKKRFSYKKEKKSADSSLSWIKDNCSNYTTLANKIAPELWKESLEYADKFKVRSDKILKTVDITLGGGGIYPFIYFIARLVKPKCVVETGVAAGYTSETFLSAIDKNGGGHLYSSDFPYFRVNNPEKYIGILVEDRLKKYWDLYLKGDQINLPKIADKVNSVNIFHYDSDKSYQGRTFALDLMKSKFSKDACIIFDDIQDNSHFRDYIAASTPQEWYIFEFEKKYIGFVGGILKYKKVNTSNA